MTIVQLCVVSVIDLGVSLVQQVLEHIDDVECVNDFLSSAITVGLNSFLIRRLGHRTTRLVRGASRTDVAHSR